MLHGNVLGTFVMIYKCMYVCMYVCMYLCMYVFMYVCISVLHGNIMHVCTFVRKYIPIAIYNIVRTYTYKHACVCMYLCKRARTHSLTQQQGIKSSASNHSLVLYSVYFLQLFGGNSVARQFLPLDKSARTCRHPYPANGWYVCM